jgi:hypothetical protein
MAVKLSCPRCGAMISVDLAGGQITVGYEMEDWRRRCDRSNADGPTTCRAALSNLKRHLMGESELVGSR